MEPEEQNSHCLICLAKPEPQLKIQLKCHHVFCSNCLKQYITVLKAYRQLTPNKLQCVHEGCSQEIEDTVLLALFPGQQGYVLKTIKKCYKQSKNPSTIIFSCPGIFKSDRSHLVEKDPMFNREQHTKKINQIVREIKSGYRVIENTKTCNNIHIYNKSATSKQKVLQCYLCGCSFCLKCFELAHDGGCPIKKDDPLLDLKKVKGADNFEDFITMNQIRRCLNPKCNIPIDKQEGCFWVKCRCSWQMCYPCGKLWGDCEHFSKYPYQKFTPPADWLVKALNLY